MKQEDSDLRQAVALFRYRLIAELVHLPAGTKGIGKRLQKAAANEVVIPGSAKTQVAAETIRDWLRAYRRGGFEALLPKPRVDRNHSRALPPKVVETLLTIKEDNLKLSVQLVIRAARASPEVPKDQPLPPSTVHRLLTRHGLMQKDPEAPTSKDRRRFAYREAGQLWMSDVMHGPSIREKGQTKRKTYLIAFIDDATRAIPYATFTFSENTRTFLPTLKQAILRRGIPKRLYVDNGANYRSHQLALVCAKLGIVLIHARPYQPQGKGKIERWFKTVRAQLLTRLTPADTQSLEALNRRLWGWVEGEYHQAPHRSLDQETPLERWAQQAENVRFPGPTLDLDQVFLFVEQRKVQKDRTVSLHGVIYEVDAAFVGQKVALHYDPGASSKQPIQVWKEGQFMQQAQPVDTYANCFIKRERPADTVKVDPLSSMPAPSGLSLRTLAEMKKDHDENEEL